MLGEAIFDGRTGSLGGAGSGSRAATALSRATIAAATALRRCAEIAFF